MHDILSRVDLVGVPTLRHCGLQSPQQGTPPRSALTSVHLVDHKA